MNALLVYPKFPDTYWGFRHSLKFIGKKASYPPLGLLTVAAMMPEDFCLRLIDMNVRPLKDEDLDWANAVFISAMLVQGPSLKTVLPSFFDDFSKGRARERYSSRERPDLSLTPPPINRRT